MEQRVGPDRRRPGADTQRPAPTSIGKAATGRSQDRSPKRCWRRATAMRRRVGGGSPEVMRAAVAFAGGRRCEPRAAAPISTEDAAPGCERVRGAGAKHRHGVDFLQHGGRRRRSTRCELQAPAALPTPVRAPSGLLHRHYRCTPALPRRRRRRTDPASRQKADVTILPLPCDATASRQPAVSHARPTCTLHPLHGVLCDARFVGRIASRGA